MSLLTPKPTAFTSIPSPSSPEWKPFISTQITSAQELLSSVTSDPKVWSTEKVYNSPQLPTQTYKSTAPPPGAGEKFPGIAWHARVSKHGTTSSTEGKLGLAKWWDGLGVNYCQNETEYGETCLKAELIEVVEEGVAEVWRVAYSLPAPTTNREFLFLLLTIAPDSPYHPTPSTDKSSGSFIIAKVPLTHEQAPEGTDVVRGSYSSVEEVKLIGEELEWRFATSSYAGGLLPKWATQMAVMPFIAEDVPSFTSWLVKRESK